MRDVIVVGGGIIGLFTASSLLDAGYDVALIDKNSSSQATRASAGVLFPTSPFLSHGPRGDYSMQSLELWKELLQQLEINPQRGIVFLDEANKRDDFLDMARRGGSLRREPLPDFICDSEITDPLILEIADGLIIDPRKIQQILRKKCSAILIEDQIKEVIGSSGSVLLRGEQDIYLAGKTVLCAGYLTSQIFDMSEKIIPTQGESFLLQTKSYPDVPGAIYTANEGLLVHYGEGNFWLGGSYHGHSEGISSFYARKILDQGMRRFPWLEKSFVQKIMRGIRPVSADGMPFVGPTSIEGVYLNTGHGKQGILQAPLSAQQTISWIGGSEGNLETLPERKISPSGF